MDENTWRFSQLMMWIIGIQTTVIMTAFGGMWMSLNKRFEDVDKRFQSMANDMKEIKDDIKEMRKDVSRIDKEVAVISATLRFNGFDLDRHKVEGE